MFKAYYFLWRRRGMCRDDFIAYYENAHVDLLRDNLPHPADFRRNYPLWSRGAAAAVGVTPPFDVLTAMTSLSQATFEEGFLAYVAQPFHDVVVEDEERFTNRAMVKLTTVDEVIDGAAERDWFPAPVLPGEGTKLVRFLRRPLGLEPDAFREAYETSAAPAVAALSEGCIDYRRNYVRTGDDHFFMTPDLASALDDDALLHCDLVEELCFVDGDHAAAAAVALDAAPPPASVVGVRRTPATTCTQHLREG